jgi:hypothetical protein
MTNERYLFSPLRLFKADEDFCLEGNSPGEKERDEPKKKNARQPQIPSPFSSVPYLTINN